MAGEKGAPRTVVLKCAVDEAAAASMVESKKASRFSSLLSRPRADEVHVHSLGLYYECVLIASGRYVADYYRRASHRISVPHGVRDVVIGGSTFAMRRRSGLARALRGSRGRNSIDVELEEHVFVDERDEVAFDRHGKKTKFRRKLDAKGTEPYPQRVLDAVGGRVRGPEMDDGAALELLKSSLKSPVKDKVRDLTEEFILDGVTHVYVPVYEARLVGPDKKVALLRIDAAKKRII